MDICSLVTLHVSDEALRQAFQETIDEIERNDTAQEPSQRTAEDLDAPAYESFEEAFEGVPSFAVYMGARNTYHRSTKWSKEKKETVHNFFRSELFWKQRQLLLLLHDLHDSGSLTQAELQSIYIASLSSTTCIEIPAIEESREYDAQPRNPTERRRFDLIKQSRTRRYTESVDKAVKKIRQKTADLDGEIEAFRMRRDSQGIFKLKP
mmetsp:Transcript_16257/g.43571  ORF Transcript_16257/g.43571 Transcript_16257/m.43571 type:complete len:208 (-) Transcript_16257:193-816(-)